MADWLLRVRALLDKHFAVVVATLVVLTLLGGWMTYTTHASPNTTTEQRTVSSWQTAAWFNHSATVTENNSVYPVGKTFSNRSIYLAEITPRLNGTYTFTYDASERGNLNGTVSLQVVLQSVQENQGRSTVVWQSTRSIETTSIDSLQPEETIRVPFSVNMNESTQRLEVIDEQLGNPPGETEVAIRATVDIQGTVNDQRVEEAAEHTLPVAPEQRTYRPATPGRITDKHETIQTVTVQKQSGLALTIGSSALLFGSALGLVGLVAARFKDRLSLTPAERELLTYDDDRQDFDEWISTIRLPDEASDLPRAEATSLGALVDFAIDTDNCVIEDPDDGAYYVVQNGYLYTYQPPTFRGAGKGIFQTDGNSEEPELTDGESSLKTMSDGDSDSSEDAEAEE